jgi:DNA-directed RNA polymerase subunit M/transcription elongation factor TFIIS
MKLCPGCGSLMHLNSYFGAYICEGCGKRDDTLNRLKIEMEKKNNIWLKLQQHDNNDDKRIPA